MTFPPDRDDASPPEYDSESDRDDGPLGPPPSDDLSAATGSSDVDYESIPWDMGIHADDSSWGQDTRAVDSSDSRHSAADDDDWVEPEELLLDAETTVFGGAIPLRVGDYRIRRLIGSGGMGRVFLAEHETMRRIVALKTLPPERMQQRTAVNRFYAEVRAAARLLHPNIVTAFDAGNAGGVHYLAMEYVDGPTLTTLVQQSGPLSIGAAVAAIRDAARGLAHAHSSGIIHRDVKPSNLMRTKEGVVKVVDLGLASVGRMTSESGAGKAAPSGKLLGTVAFMSPEQLENPDTVDARSDIYSLGATFCFLLTGRPPYEGNFLDQVRGHRHDPLPELFAVRPDADLRLEHVLHRMMAKRPQDRYGSLTEVIADLAEHDTTADAPPAWVAGLPVHSLFNDQSSVSGGGSSREDTTQVMAIDSGMFHIHCAVADPTGNVNLLYLDDQRRPQYRVAIADGNPPVFGMAAMEQREKRPGSVLHCLPLYIGQRRSGHVIAGRQCPAEVLIGMQLRHVMQLGWQERRLPRAVGITVPSCYDQQHRQAILQAAAIAGLPSVRLVDRSLAALQSWHWDLAQQNRPPVPAVPAPAPAPATATAATAGTTAPSTATPSGLAPGVAPASTSERIDRQGDSLQADEMSLPQMVISITGNATEVVIARRRGPRMVQLASVGQRHRGILQWQQKLVDLAVNHCRQTLSIDPMRSLGIAAAMQMACERAMSGYLLSDQATIRIPHRGRWLEFSIPRDRWMAACQPLLTEVQQMIDRALKRARTSPAAIRHCLLFGLPTRLPGCRQAFAARLSPRVQWVNIDRADVARGAAACVAGELPGRGDIPLPPQAALCHDLGLLVLDHHGHRRIRTMLPSGTLIPARTSRRIAAGKTATQSLALVESANWPDPAWLSLGVHSLTIDPENPNLELTFEVDLDGMLIIRRRDPQTGVIERLPARPQPPLPPAELAQWAEWVAELLPAPKRWHPTDRSPSSQPRR